MIKILHLGTEVGAKGGGMPEYERNFVKFMPYQNVFLSIALSPMQEESKQIQLSPTSKEILINIPKFDEQSDDEVFKYSKMTQYLQAVLGVFRPDVIITNDWFWTPALMAIRGLPPVIYFVHLLYSKLHQKFNMTVPRIEMSEDKAFHEIATEIVANSKSTAADIKEIYPDVASKVVAIPLGIDRAEYPAMPNLTSRIILYNGRLQGEKGIERFVRDIRANIGWLHSNGFQVLISGEGSMLQDVFRLQKETGGIVKVLGLIDGQEKRDVLSSAKYMVFPSEYEPYGLSLNEGLSIGKICIATDVGGHGEQVANNKNGFLLKPGESFIQKIAQIEQNPKLQEKIINNAMKTASDIKNHMDTMRGVIDNVVQQSRKEVQA